MLFFYTVFSIAHMFDLFKHQKQFDIFNYLHIKQLIKNNIFSCFYKLIRKQKNHLLNYYDQYIFL